MIVGMIALKTEPRAETGFSISEPNIQPLNIFSSQLPGF